LNISHGGFWREWLGETLATTYCLASFSANLEITGFRNFEYQEVNDHFLPVTTAAARWSNLTLFETSFVTDLSLGRHSQISGFR